MLEGTASRAAELKAQGALEAAQDPDSNVDAQQAEQVVVQQARAAGAPTFVFDPDATPEQKAAQMKEQTQIHHRKHQTAALVSDQDDGQTAGYDLPPPSKAGAVSAPSSPNIETNGSITTDDVYSKTGFAPRFGNPGDNDQEATLTDHQDFIEARLDDKFFGDWYHNAAVIVFACLASWVVAVLGGGLGWIFIVMATCGTYYRTSLRRVRRNFRDDLQREMAKARLETDAESLEWINNFLVKFWPIFAPQLCASIIASVDQVLSTSTPAFLDSMRMKFFTLGTKPPRLEHVKTYPRAEDDIVIMDWKFSFTPNDIADLTHAQIKNKINPKLVLEVRVGKAMISTGLDVIVEDMACSGLMRVKIKLQIPFPHVERVEISFLERPTIDYVCKPIGGDLLGFDLNFIPGLESFILEQIHANLAPMMYDPNVFPIEVAKMLSGNPVDQAIGVLQVHFHGAHGLKNTDKFAGTPDPYAVVSLNNREPLGRTKTVHENANPRWDETVNIILTSLKEPLTIQVYDFNEYRKDKELGVATVNLENIMDNQDLDNQTLEVMSQGRSRGAVQCDIRFFPVLEGQKLADGTEVPPPESLTGIAKFTVEQAKDLDGSKSMIGQLNPYAVLLLNGKEIQTSQKLKRNNNPIWSNASKELLISDRKHAKLGVVIKDDRDLAADPILGSYQIKLDDMLDLMSKGQEWYNLAGAKAGRVKMLLDWKPVALRGAASGGGYITPIGVMRVHLKSAQGLKNVEAVGKSDPYARVLLSGIQKGRTVTWKNNLNPEWDEVIYVPVHSTREKLVIEVMDEENIGKDRTLGQLEISASEYISLGDDGEYLIHDTKDVALSAPLRIGHGSAKGTLNYSVAFYPTVNVVDPEDEEEDEEKAAENVTADATPSSPEHKRNGTVSSVTTAATSKSQDTDLAKTLARNENEQAETQEIKAPEPPKIKITADDLIKYESGLLVFKIIDGELAHPNTHFEVLIDDMLYPSYSSGKMKGGSANFNETSDAMIRELDLSRITLRLVSNTEKKDGDDPEDDVKARVVGSTFDTLRRALYTPTQFALKDKQGHESKVTVSMRFLPVKMQLDPSESFNNSGNLRVEVLDGAELPAADRNGYSDPYCKFILNGTQVFKSATQKKTLHPAWNEAFDVPVRSRTAAKFRVEVYDWDRGNQDDLLGGATIDLSGVEPFQSQEVTSKLDGKSGTVRMKLLFKPDYITRSRQGSSTFQGTFAAPGKIIGAPVKGATMIGGAAMGGVAKGTGFFTKGFRRSTSGNHAAAPSQDMSTNGVIVDAKGTSMESTTLPQIAEPDSGSPNAHKRTSSFGQFSQSPAAEQGLATISVLHASGFQADSKLEVRVLHDSTKGLKEVYKTKAVKSKTGEATFEEDSKKVPCNADQAFRVLVRNQHTFGSDDLGEASFHINDQSGGGTQDIKVGTGSVTIRSSFQSVDAASLRPVSRLGTPAGDSPKGKTLSRFISRRERSITPSG